MRTMPGHKKVAVNLVEQVKNGGLPIMVKAAEESGYSASHSHEIAKRESFRKILFEAVPFDLLAKQQKILIEARTHKVMRFKSESSEEEILKLAESEGIKVLHIYYDEQYSTYELWIREPNYEYIDRGLDKMYKLMGEYAPDKLVQSRPLEEMTDDELKKLAEQVYMLNKPLHKEVIDVTDQQ